MRSVLGIDAAWTIRNPSGVALVEETTSGWRLVCVESSYERFQSIDRANTFGFDRASTGSEIDATAILNACHERLGRSVDLVAIDMPLARTPIRQRRTADNAISKEYGGRKASTHSPSEERPGVVSDEMTAAFARAGYPLQTQALRLPGVIEVYPHPALIELTGAPERLMYKCGKSKKYWPHLEINERRVKLYKVWSTIVQRLDRVIVGVGDLLPPPPLVATKAYEDKLDAVVCAWVGVCALNNRAKAFGDYDAAIWVPVAGG